MKLAYVPSEDKLTLEIHPAKKRRDRKWKPLEIKATRFIVWLDDEKNICAIVIQNYAEELREFREKLKEYRENMNVIRLRGIWKRVKITDEDIKEARTELLKQLEGRW